ncbi:hypothetical protein BH11BAC4_BH11BAC4_05910 [soil metagenome]
MRKTIVIAVLSFTGLVSIGVTGCYYDKEDLLYPVPGTVNCATTAAKFSVDITSIMQNNCATSGCHDAATNAGGTTLVNYTQVSAAAARIRQRCIIDKTMPPGAPLSTAEIAALKCWIDAGTPNN